MEDNVCATRGQKVKVDGLSGWRCGACGEVEFDPERARRYAAAGDALLLRERQGKEIRRISPARDPLELRNNRTTSDFPSR
jgi:hypothetical protein